MAQPLVLVHGKFVSGSLPAQGMLTFSDLSFSVDSVDGTVNAPVKVEAYLDQNGEFFTRLPLNVGYGSTPQPRSYHCTVAVEGTAMDFDFMLSPSDLTVEFSDIVPLLAPPVLPPQYVASIGGLSGVITYADFVATFPTLSPAAGKSAYQLWLDQGNTGALSDFFAALRGLQGLPGAQGPVGPEGKAGPRGARGSAGPAGRPFRIDVIVAEAANLTAGGGAVTTDNATTMFPRDSMAAVLSTRELWYFDGVEWQNLGSYKGDTGPAGPSATKQSIGLGNVDNTSDVNKPVSAATQTALDQLAANVGKVQSVNGQQGTVVLGAGDVGLGNVANITPAQWPFSTALTTRLGQLDTAVAAKYTKPAGGTVGKFLQGDDTFKVLTPSDVGLGNLRNFPSMGELDAVTNLDSMVSTGTWLQPLDASATTALSYPVASRGGFLRVLANNTGTRLVEQTYVAYGYSNVPPRVYTRSCFAAQPWSAWRQVLVNGIEDIVAASLRTSSGHGFAASGSALARSVLFGSFTEAQVNAASTIVYPFPPTAASLWSAFPQGMSIWRLSAGANGSPADYPILTGTLIMQRHDGYPRQEVYGVGQAYYRIAASNAWQPWKPMGQEMASGQVVTALTANVIKDVVVTFPPGRFSSVPVVQVTAQTTVPDRVRASTHSADVNGFTMACWRNTDANTTFNWLAVYTP